jgi:hypothetical protein
MRVRIKTKQIDFIVNDFNSDNSVRYCIKEIKELIVEVVEKSKELINEQNKLS